jgi:hypothetical protein
MTCFCDALWMGYGLLFRINHTYKELTIKPTAFFIFYFRCSHCNVMAMTRKSAGNFSIHATTSTPVKHIVIIFQEETTESDGRIYCLRVYSHIANMLAKSAPTSH